MSTNLDNFKKDLRRLRRTMRAAQLFETGVSLLVYATGAFLLYLLSDWVFAFEPLTRLTLGTALVIALVFVAMLRVVQLCRYNLRDVAQKADTLLNSKRRSVLSAHELTAAQHESGTMANYLVERSIRSACEELQRLRMKNCWPWHRIRRKLLYLAACILALGAFGALYPQTFLTISSRVAAPFSDHPPVSDYSFSVKPQNPSVLYGKNVELAVYISGNPVKEQVWCLTRSGGKTYRNACFKRSDNQYVVKLENVIEELDFCFATGKARSKWHSLNLKLRPQVQSAAFTVVPPDYSKLPERKFRAGEDEISALKRSRVKLEIESNRPLSGGILKLKPGKSNRSERIVEGTVTDRANISFEWTLKRSGIGEVIIRDVRSTSIKEPFSFEQKVTADRPPKAVLTEPDQFALATPTSRLPLEGYASDDFGLKKVELVRGLVGYRDRIHPLNPPAGSKHFEFERELNLKKLGVEPGQQLEFYVDAADTNPALMGVTASDVIKVQVISKEKYAQILRRKSTVREFRKRYTSIRKQLNSLTETLQELRSAAQENADIEKALTQARKNANRLADNLDKLASDFPIYEFEKGLADLLDERAQRFEKIAEKLNELKSGDKNVATVAGNMLDELRASRKPLNRNAEQAEGIATAAELIKLAVRISSLADKQAKLARRLERYRDVSAATDGRLSALGEKQEHYRTEWKSMIKEIKRTAEELPKAYRALGEHARKFAKTLQSSEALDAMREASVAADNQDGEKTYTKAKLASERLQQLMKQSSEKGNCFAGLCRGKTKPNVFAKHTKTLKQMLRQIATRAGRLGTGSGPDGVGFGRGGVGMQGGGSDGYWMQGYSALNTPMYGPDRSRWSSGPVQAQQTEKESGANKTGGGGTSTQLNANQRENLPGGEGQERSESLQSMQVPPDYREAVKRYFSNRGEEQ